MSKSRGAFAGSSALRRVAQLRTLDGKLPLAVVLRQLWRSHAEPKIFGPFASCPIRGPSKPRAIAATEHCAGRLSEGSTDVDAQAGDGKAMPRRQRQMDTWRTVQADRQTEPRVDAGRPPKKPPGRAVSSTVFLQLFRLIFQRLRSSTTQATATELGPWRRLTGTIHTGRNL
jgi:hypothetical protein